MKSLPLDEFLDQVVHSIVRFSINLAIAILVFYIGKFIIAKIYGLISRILVRRKVDQSLATFLLSMARILLYFILIVTVIGILGIETSSFIALFASAGVAIGMALSGTLQNFAGGVLILLLKPYKVGQYIETQNYAGTVSEIQIFSTVITTFDNKSIIIPNGPLSTSSINNWSRESYRRVDWNVSIAYGDDISVAEKAILRILKEDGGVLHTSFAEDRRMRLESQNFFQAEDSDLTDTSGAEADNAATDTKRGRWSWLRKKKRAGHATRLIKSASLPDMHNPNSPAEHEDRKPSVVLNNLGESSVDLKVRAWVPTTDYWAVYYRVYRRIYDELGRPDSGVHFPFPQLDVHIQNEKA